MLYGEVFCLTMKYLLKKFRKSQTRFSRNSRKISLQSKRISKKGVVGVVLMREEKAFSEKKFSQVSRNCVALKSHIWMFFGGGYLYLDGTDLR